MAASLFGLNRKLFEWEKTLNKKMILTKRTGLLTGCQAFVGHTPDKRMQIKVVSLFTCSAFHHYENFKVVIIIWMSPIWMPASACKKSYHQQTLQMSEKTYNTFNCLS